MGIHLTTVGCGRLHMVCRCNGSIHADETEAEQPPVRWFSDDYIGGYQPYSRPYSQPYSQPYSTPYV